MPRIGPILRNESAPSCEPMGADGVSGLTLDGLIHAYLAHYELQQYRTLDTARGRVAHLAAFFGSGCPAAGITTDRIQQYQQHRRREGAAAATINRETSALSRMCRLAVRTGRLTRMAIFPDRLRENPPRQGFFEHREYLAVRRYLPPAYQDILDFAYYSGWRRREITGLTWDEVDLTGGVIRLTPHRSKTRTGRVLPISEPLAAVLQRRLAKRRPGDPTVFQRDGIPIRRWRKAWGRACRLAGVPGRILHDCRRTAARNLIRAGVPERIAMALTGHKTRAIFDRYNIVNEHELLDAGERLVAYLQTKAVEVGAAATATAPPLRPRAHAAASSQGGSRRAHRSGQLERKGTEVA